MGSEMCIRDRPVPSFVGPKASSADLRSSAPLGPDPSSKRPPPHKGPDPPPTGMETRAAGAPPPSHIPDDDPLFLTALWLSGVFMVWREFLTVIGPFIVTFMLGFSLSLSLLGRIAFAQH